MDETGGPAGYSWSGRGPGRLHSSRAPLSGVIVAAVVVLLAGACSTAYRPPRQPQVYALLYATAPATAPVTPMTATLGPTPAPSPAIVPTEALAATETPAPVTTISAVVPRVEATLPATVVRRLERSTPSPKPEGTVPLADGGCPYSHPVKLAASGLVYSYRSPIYARVTPVACYTSVAAANGERASGH